MNKAPRFRPLLYLLLPWLSQGALALAPPERNGVDEVVVEATRAQLSAMREEMVQLEERFFDRYND